MDFTILTLAIAIIGCVLSIATFVLNRKDKSNKDEKSDGYKWGAIDEKLANIEKTLNKIEDKLDNYDIEIESKIKEAMKHHIAEFHNRG